MSSPEYEAALDEIERLRARVAELEWWATRATEFAKRDQRRETLLREAVDELQTALSANARTVAARIRTELGEGK